jgi:hypothetical protein
VSDGISMLTAGLDYKFGWGWRHRNDDRRTRTAGYLPVWRIQRATPRATVRAERQGLRQDLAAAKRFADQ